MVTDTRQAACLGHHRHSIAAKFTALAVLLVSALATDNASAQDQLRRTAGFSAGASFGKLYEVWEGQGGSVTAWTVIVGYDFNRRWGIRTEIGPGFDMCDRDVVIVRNSGQTQGSCHRHGSLISPAVTLRAQSHPLYLTLGFLQAGLGLEIPIGRHVAASAEVDAGYRFSSATARPRVALRALF